VLFDGSWGLRVPFTIVRILLDASLLFATSKDEARAGHNRQEFGMLWAGGREHGIHSEIRLFSYVVG
jgi:hypothetical protein